jgi:hypothetical protein
MRKRGKTISLIFILWIFLIGTVNAIVCCERTNSGAWCQNVVLGGDCATGNNPLTGQPYRKIAAYCEATSYCKPGTCINNQEGTCMSNTPEIVCEGNYGFWSDKPKEEIPQCKLGCCLIGDQAAFVTQVGCNRLSSLYGLEVNYRTDIDNEFECLVSANPGVKGACVYTANYIKTCELTTKKECQDKQKSSASTDVKFHEGYLCSANELGTICAKSQQTKCEGDDVYFVDTCGNLANLYDSSKINDELYWTKIQEPTCTSTSNPGNKDSAKCGDCDYYSGSMCQEKKTGDSVDYGNYLCKDLDCKDYRGAYSGSSTGIATASSYPKHGESWCATDAKKGNENHPGSVYYRLLCYNGEVSVEICDTTRQKICAQKKDEESGFFTGNCKVNIWQDCSSQTTKEACEDVNARDCKWITEKAGTGGGNYYFTEEGMKNDEENKGACAPKYNPGFERDGSNNAIGGETCGIANAICYVKMEKGLLDAKWKCTQNCSCLDSNWEKGLNKICSSLGDCGSNTNLIGKNGQKQEVISKIKGET